MLFHSATNVEFNTRTKRTLSINKSCEHFNNNVFGFKPLSTHSGILFLQINISIKLSTYQFILHGRTKQFERTKSFSNI